MEDAYDDDAEYNLSSGLYSYYLGSLSVKKTFKERVKYVARFFKSVTENEVEKLLIEVLKRNGYEHEIHE